MPTVRERLREGLPVYSADGHRMGRLVRCGPTMFEVECGFFFPRDFLVRYDEVAELTDERVTLALAREELRREWRRAYVLGDRPPAPTDPPIAPHG